MKKVGQKIVVQSSKSMHAKNFLLLTLLFSTPCLSWERPPAPPQNRMAACEDFSTVIKQMRFTLSELKNETRNHETEIRMYEERLTNQENSNEQMRQQLSDEFQSQKDFNRATLVTLQSKFDQLTARLASLETQVLNLSQSFSHVTEDLRNNASQTNENLQILKEYKQIINELSDKTTAQDHLIINLESALQTVMELMQPKEPVQVKNNISNDKIYKVQPGDSLEKIARAHRTTTQQLKEINQLSSDRINIGQRLKIPS